MQKQKQISKGVHTVYPNGEEFERKVSELQASEEVKKAIRAEIRRYRNMGANNSEGQVIRNYIETLLSLPWDKGSEENIDIKRASEILERDHYGLEKVKERILAQQCQYGNVGCGSCADYFG